MKLKNKRNIILIITLITIFISIFSPVFSVLADEDDANQKLNEEINKYIGEEEDFTDVIERLQEDSKTNKNPSKNTILHIMKRLFAPGEYLNDVEDGVLARELGVTKDDILYNNRYLCNPNSPNNLINHNCNIPNFTTDLIQTFFTPLTSPFNNAGKTSSYASFGFGVPKDIPGEIVPVDPNQRIHTYTALELYGYNLPRISYNGEWDKIEISSEARMLSNFGIIDKFTLMGTGLWNSIKSGIGALIENFSFNPFRWSKGITKSLEGFLTGGINVVIDTSDMNVVATNSWKRNSFNGTLYNVYVLTDKEVLLETNKKYFQLFINKLSEKAEVSPELLEVLALQQIPGFTFDPEWETDESIAAREAAEAHNASESSMADSDEDYSPSYVTVPEPVYYTEEEQLDFWAEDNADILSRGAAQGLISGNSADYVEYEPLVEAWNEAWEEYFSREFNALGDVVNDLIEESDLEVFMENPHLDPKQGISHYACANTDGTIMKDSGGNIEYLYLNNNKGNQEYINPRCSPARAPIGGGLLGSGWHISRPVDTRHINVVSGNELSNTITSNFTSMGKSSSMGFNSFIAQLTNTVIDLAFSPILDELGITTIISELVAGFRDTIFFPMSALMAAIGGILLFFRLLQNASAWQLIVSIFLTFLIFIAGATFLLNPEMVVNLVDKAPTRIENYLADVILVDDDGSSYCSTGEESDGIRSAQCNIWGAMVFNPWVYTQFGTRYEDLFANGYAPSNGTSFENTNETLVGNAEVNMGGGYKLNNWAIFQLDKIKAGTINNDSIPTKAKIGSVDKELYKMVDLQAGPDNGAGTDPKHFKVWSGQETVGSLGIIFTIQTILMSIALVSISFLKIEASFVFSLSILILPFMLLYGLLPQGKHKLKNYISSLLSLLIKRAVIVVMLTVLLKIYTLSFAMVDSVITASYISIGVSVAFMLYKKEMLSLIIASEGGSNIKEMVSDSIPINFKHSYEMNKSKVKGTVAGFVGGLTGAMSYKNDVKKEIKSHENEIDKFKEISVTRPLSTEEQDRFEKIKTQLEEAQVKKDFLEDKDQNLMNVASLGSRQTAQIIGRRTERSIRRKGFSGTSVYSQAKEKVLHEGADSITNKDEPTALDTYKELLSHSEMNTSKTSQQGLSLEEARLLKNTKIQKKVRELAKEREKIAKKNISNDSHNALSPDIEEMEKIAKYIDRKRKVNNIKGNIIDRNHEKQIKEEIKEKEKYIQSDSNVSTIIKEEIDKQLEKEKQEIKKERGE